MSDVPVQAGTSQEFKLLGIFTGLFVASLVIATVASTKIFALGPLNLPGGTLVFPVTFILNDILTETYGFARSRRVIWTALACQALAGATLWLVGALPPASFWPNQEAYDAVLGFVPRVAAGGLSAFFLGEFANSYVISKMKYKQGGKRGLKQGWRFVASTIVGEGVDSVVFMTIAFAGTMSVANLLTTMVTVYVVKVIYEIVALPVSMRVADWIKRVEGEDHIDSPATTNYNPFTAAQL